MRRFPSWLHLVPLVLSWFELKLVKPGKGWTEGCSCGREHAYIRGLWGKSKGAAGQQGHGEKRCFPYRFSCEPFCTIFEASLSACMKERLRQRELLRLECGYRGGHTSSRV
jgi:hypothetical protein